MNMSGADAQSRLLQHLYAGTIEYGQWTQMLKLLAEASGAANGSLAVVNPRSGKPILQYTSHAFERSWYEEYRQHFANVSPIRAAMFKRAGRAMACHQIMPSKRFENTEFYRDYLHKYNLRYVLGAACNIAGGASAYIALHRERHSAEFDDGLRNLVQSVLPHLELAFRIKSDFVGMSRYEDVSLQYLDSLGKGLICLDRNGGVLSMNKEAERVLRHGDALFYQRGRIVAHHPDDNRRLENLIARSCQTDIVAFPTITHPNTGGSIAIRRSGGGVPYTLWIFPVIGRNAYIEHFQIAAAIEISDPLTDRQPSAQEMLGGYGLTAAEMRLAQALTEGVQLKTAAARFGITLNTVKNQRRSLYRKLGISRQFELLRLVRQSAKRQ